MCGRRRKANSEKRIEEKTPLPFGPPPLASEMREAPDCSRASRRKGRCRVFRPRRCLFLFPGCSAARSGALLVRDRTTSEFRTIPGLRSSTACCSAPGKRCLLALHCFAVQREVEALALDLFFDAQSDDDVDHLEDDQADDRAVDEHDHDALDLVDELSRVAFEQAGGSAILLDREHPGQQRADDAADRMDAEG